MNCPVCRKPVIGEKMFCTGCGARLNELAAAPVRDSSLRKDSDDGVRFDFHHFAEGAAADILGAADSLNLPPPPALPQGDWGMIAGEDGGSAVSGLAELAAASGYSLYDPSMVNHATGPQTPSQRLMAVVSMIFVFIMVAGIPLYPIATAGMKSRSVSGLVENREFGFSLVIPSSGWHALKNPKKKTRTDKTGGYFFKGSPLNPSLEVIIVYVQRMENAPENISFDQLEQIEPGFRNHMESFMSRMGMKYELLQTKLFTVNHRDAIWLDGNISCRGCVTRRNFTFYAFSSTSLYGVIFNLDEKNTDYFWPEIESILGSLEFYEKE